jgi:hypothetical protein
MARTRKSASALFDAISLEGNLITPAMLTRVAAHEAGSQSEADYGVPKGLTLRDEIARHFRIGQALFKELFASAAPSTSATSNFAEALLRDVFGFSDLRRVGMRSLGERFFPLTMEALAGRVPVVVVPPSDELDRASTHLHTEGRRRSAASSVQDWLNVSEKALWGFCCNGERLRLVRDNASLTRPAYVEANLRQMFEAEDFADFAALWLLIQVTRFGAIGAPIADCSLERWREAGGKEGESARERLRGGVEAALLALGNGFLSHPDNAALRERIVTNQLPLPDFFGQLLRLVYRLIFLLAAEDRGLLHPPGVSASIRKLYADGYSLGALRDSAVRRSTWDRHHDRWEGLLITFAALAQGEPQLGLPALGGIFDTGVISDLESIHISNRALMEAIYRLAWLKDSASLMPVNWRDMETEELGSVYEGLLELTPRLTDNGRGFAFAEGAETKGNERKTTGSYYTPDSLVQALLDSALDPVLDRVESEAEDAAAALLAVTVIDPACGSGHFLLAAARRIATRVAHARAEGVASAEDYRHALRDVARSCIHGVDRNPMAVELTKVALWIETVEPGKPLGFLDANIRCGDSLFGVYDLEVLREGIPDAAYKPLSGDDKVIARDFEKRNKAQRTGQGTLFGAGHGLPAPPPLAGAARELRALPEDNSQQVAEKRRRFAEAESDAQRWNWRQAANAYIAAFVIPKTKKEAPSLGTATIPTTEDVFHQISVDSVVYGPRVGRIQELADVANPFHWPLEFPDIMERGGFDVVLGNPPWEVMQLGEEEYFAQRLPEIAELVGAIRKRAIAALEASEPGVFASYQANKRLFEVANIFAKESGRFDLTANGKINTYSLFAELFTSLVSSRGRAGIIVPTGIATDLGTAVFFSTLIERHQIAQLLDFENRDAIFPAVHRSYKFTLLTIGRTAEQAAKFAFFLANVGELSEPRRCFSLSSAEIAKINPNTKTAPVFRSRADAELTAKIYGQVPVLIDDSKGVNGNPWEITFHSRLWHMAEDSEWFRTAEELKQDGFELRNGLLEPRTGTEQGRYVPVYEAKMVHQLDHRWSTYDNNESRNVTEAEKRNRDFEPSPRYWVSEDEVRDRLSRNGWTHQWLMGWRNICRSTDERTVIASVVPRYAVGHSMPLVFPLSKERPAALLLANLSSLILDYVARQKVGGTNLTFNYFKQFPVLPPSSYNDSDERVLIPIIKELVYTSRAMAPFARDLGYEGPPFAWDEGRRALLRAELDAWYARAYGLTRDELRYILDPADVKGKDYPSETFRVLKNSDIKRFGKYRTQELVLEAWDRLEKGDNVILPIAKPLPQIPINTDLLRDNSWATASDLPAYTVTQLAGVIHRLPGPTPIARVRVAALFALEPQLLTRHLSGKWRATWLRLVGSAARVSQVGNVLSFSSKIDLSWGRAVTQLRGMGELAEDLNVGTWAAGSPVSQYAIDGWAVGRAEFVLGALTGISIDEWTADLSPEDRAWVNAAYVA